MGGTERTIFGQLFTQLHKVPPKSLRNAERAWHVTMVGFFADDYGGPYRESLADVCSEWKSPVLPLFIQCPNGRAGLGRNQHKWIPNPSATTPSCLDMFEFVGKIFGIALRTKE